MIDTLGSLSAFALWSALAAYAGWHLRGTHERRKRDRRIASLVAATRSTPAASSNGKRTRITKKGDLQA